MTDDKPLDWHLPTPERPSPVHWEPMRSRPLNDPTEDDLTEDDPTEDDPTEDDPTEYLAAFQALLQDAGTILRWSRMPLAAAPPPPVPPHPRPARKAAAAVSLPEPLFSGDLLLVIRWEKDLDLSRSPTLLTVLRALAAEASTAGHAIVVDLREIGFLDASGVSALATGRKALTAQGLRLWVLLPPGEQPERVFQATGLARIITQIASLDEL